MEHSPASVATPTTPRKKMTKQLTGKRDDTALHSAARAGNIIAIREMIEEAGEDNLEEILSKQNSSGETALYVAAEYGYFEVVREMIKHYDLVAAGIKARNGFDALHIAAKQGDLEVVKVLLEAHPELSMTVDMANTTALHTAATQGHIEVVNHFLESESSLANIARSNGKTALHSAARNGHVRVVKALLSKEPGIITRTDKKGQTALHMAVKGQNLELVEELIRSDPLSINMVDTKGNTALHIATRKGRAQAFLNIQLYEKALDLFEDDQSTAVILHKHLLRTAACQMVDNLLVNLDIHNKWSQGVQVDESQNSGMVSLTSAERLALAKSLPGSLSIKAIQVAESLEGKRVELFMNAARDLAVESGLDLKKLDKKLERTLLHSYRKDLTSQVSAETDPVTLLPKVVSLLFVQMYGKALQAPGRAISAAVSRLKDKLDDVAFKTLADYQAAAVSLLSLMSASTGNAEDCTSDRFISKRELLEGSMPALKSLVLGSSQS